MASEVLSAPSPDAPAEMHVVWITAGLSCDGDTIAMTAATQPEHRGPGARRHPRRPGVVPAQPGAGLRDRRRVHRRPAAAAAGELGPFILVVEGSIPNERNKTARLLGRVRHRPGDRPADPRPATGSTASRRRPGRWWPPGPAPPTAASTPWPATRPAAWAWPTTSAGSGGRRRASPSSACPAARSSPTTSWRRCSTCCARPPGTAPMIPLDEALRPTLAVRPDRPRGLRPRRLLRAGRLRRRTTAPKCIVKLGCWGPVVQCNVGKRGWMNGIGGCPNVGGVCIGCTMPGFPDKFMPFMDEPPGANMSTSAVLHLRPDRPGAAPVHPGLDEPRAGVAQPRRRRRARRRTAG